MELTVQQKNDLNKFSLILEALGLDGGVKWVYQYDEIDWSDGEGPLYKGRINTTIKNEPESIKDLFNSIIEDFDTDLFYNDRDGTSYGNLEFIIDYDERKIFVNYDHYQTETEYYENDVSFNKATTFKSTWGDSSNMYDVLKLLINEDFINNMINKYGNIIRVAYDGSGDDGWVSDEMEVGEGNVNTDKNIEKITYVILGYYYSGWENNEGSSGSVTYNFENKTFNIQHESRHSIEVEENYKEISF
jgi:hypothetical protein